jgi:hypothetical protein
LSDFSSSLPADRFPPALQNTSTPALAPTSSPTETLRSTQTFTPEPTLTPTPTETPGPYWQLGNFGEYIHAVNDNGQETFNFLAPFEQWPESPNLDPSTIKAYHDALKTIKLSDGSLLVQPMNTEEFISLPDLNWKIQDWTNHDSIWIGNENVGNKKNPPAKYVGGFMFHYNGSDINEY